jgi:hypothetical protein
MPPLVKPEKSAIWTRWAYLSNTTKSPSTSGCLSTYRSSLSSYASAGSRRRIREGQAIVLHSVSSARPEVALDARANAANVTSKILGFGEFKKVRQSSYSSCVWINSLDEACGWSEPSGVKAIMCGPSWGGQGKETGKLLYIN